MEHRKTEIGARLRAARVRLGWTQQAVATSLDITRQAVAKQEAGDSAMTVARLMALCELYGVTYDEILLGRVRYSMCPPEGRPSCRALMGRSCSCAAEPAGS